MKSKFPPEAQERAVRLVAESTKDLESQWAAIRSVAEKLGCSPETLRRWIRISENNKPGSQVFSSTERERLKQLERENKELRRSNEILKAASAFFAKAEFDRHMK